MNKSDQELCLKEISGELLDSGTTVNISTLSENWGMSMKASAEVLEKWLETHGGGRMFFKQFLVRGLRDDGSMLMTIIPECDLATITKKLCKCIHMLYSIKEGTEPPAISIPPLLECKKKRLIVSCSERKSQLVVEESDEKPEKVMKQEKNTAPSSQFPKPSSKVTNGQANNNIANMFKNVKSEPKTPTKEQVQSNIQKNSPKKKSPNKKDVKKNGSIGLFFSSKPQSQCEKSSPPVEDNKKQSQGNNKDLGNTKSEAVNGKRSSISKDQSENSEEKSPASPDNPPKRRKVDDKKKARAKGSRIMLMVDSDDDEEPRRKFTSDDEVVEPVKTPTPEKKTNRSLEPALNGSKPAKAKKRRMVTKTYEDENGYINTVKESEVYSSSEPEENEQPPKEEKQSVSIKIEVKKKVNTSPPKTTKATRKPASKQGSIMSFFSKK